MLEEQLSVKGTGAPHCHWKKFNCFTIMISYNGKSFAL